MLKRLFILSIVCGFSSALFSQIVTVKSAFDQDSVMIGKQLHYTISAESNPGVSIALPDYTDTITGQIEIVVSYPVDTTVSDGKMTISKSFRVTSFKPGWNTVPPQPVSFQTDEIADTVYTTANLITVLTPAVDTSQAIKPIKPPLNTPVTLAEIYPWILVGIGGLLFITLIWALLWIWLQKKKDPEQFMITPEEPAHIIAFRSLEELKRQNLPEKGRVKDFYSTLTEIIRKYMARQFSIHAMESTTQEILEAFSVQNRGEKELNQRLEHLLMLADLVKFAKEDPTPEENETHMQNAADFVEKTYKMFSPEEDDEGAGGEDRKEISDVETEKPEVGNG